jgi:hypothetical protein
MHRSDDQTRWRCSLCSTSTVALSQEPPPPLVIRPVWSLPVARAHGRIRTTDRPARCGLRCDHMRDDATRSNAGPHLPTYLPTRASHPEDGRVPAVRSGSRPRWLLAGPRGALGKHVSPCAGRLGSPHRKIRAQPRESVSLRSGRASRLAYPRTPIVPRRKGFCMNAATRYSYLALCARNVQIRQLFMYGSLASFRERLAFSRKHKKN